MNALINLFITQGIPLLSLKDLEEYTGEWYDIKGCPLRDTVLPYLINQKLQRNEEEY